MKILYSCLSKSWGGMEMFTLTAVRQLLNRNIYVELLCTAESRLHIEANNIGIIIHPVKASGYFSPFSVLKIASIIRMNKYDIIHSHASRDLWFLVSALKLLRKKNPLILTKHVGSFIIKKDFLHKWIYNRVTFVLAISEVIRKNLLETCPLPEKKVKLLHNGIDLEKFNPAKYDGKKTREEFSVDGNEILIGMLARFSRGKGHEEFLYAAKELNQQYNNLKFLIVGEASRGEDEYASSIKKLAEKYEIKNLIFSGFRSDTPEILTAMDIFIFPSHSEAFGIALAEAMAMGKPSVCSNSDGILDIAVDNETSYLFERKNGDDLVKKLKLLVNDPETRVKFGKAARIRAEKNFNIKRLTDRVIEIYYDSLKK
jgi:glycosyltransferase involved in cell wall biosynthesis